MTNLTKRQMQSLRDVILCEYEDHIEEWGDNFPLNMYNEYEFNGWGARIDASIDYRGCIDISLRVRNIDVWNDEGDYMFSASEEERKALESAFYFDKENAKTIPLWLHDYFPARANMTFSTAR